MNEKEKTKMTKKYKRNQGITLIALVITIIVLLILAGVTVAMLTGENGILTQTTNAKVATEEARKKEEAELLELEQYMNQMVVSEEGYNASFGVNSPKLKSGMIPVYYEEGSKVWKKADQGNKDKQWYDYSAKKWANIVTVADSDKNLREASVGTEIPMDKITTFFVWIPRYSYSITSGYQQGNGTTGKIDVTFLKGNTNVGSDNVSYQTDYDESKLTQGNATPKIVHPGFSFGNTQLSGIWVAKFEASGKNTSGQAVGNASSTSGTPVAIDNSTYVRIVPSTPSWRHIQIGEAQYQSMNMASKTSNYGWQTTVNSHLIKDSEWGTVAYLSYSQYGSVPKINGSGTLVSNSHWYNLYTGAGPKSSTDEGYYSSFTEANNGYNSTLGQLASTTGNSYGIYDMNGGAWERVAAYLDNGNGNLSGYGNSASNSSMKYFEGNQLKSEYANYWNTYEAAEEEKSNKIKVEGVGEISQGSLWNWNNKSLAYNQARQRITKYAYDHLPKGTGTKEMSNINSYYAPYGTNSASQGWSWFVNAQDTATNTSTNYARTWDGDYVLQGHASIPFVGRGGYCGGGSGAGVLFLGAADGDAYSDGGFRPVLAF